MKFAPHDYQRKAIKFGLERSHAAFFLDPGLGKTAITFAMYKVLQDKGMVDRVLVIAPLRPAQSVWPREAEKWDDFKHVMVRVLHGGKKEDRLEQGLDEGGFDVINPEGLEWLFNAEHLKRWRKAWPWDMLVLDESTKFKNTSSLRFKLLKPSLPRFKRRYILTGSPAPNGLMDLFGQVYALDYGNALGRFVTQYRREYFDQSGFGGYTWTPKPEADKRIHKVLRPIALRMEATDYLTLPPLIYNTIRVELGGKARRVYDSMEKLLFAAVDDATVTAANAATATVKCRQLANGGIYRDDRGEGWRNVHDAKTDAVVDLLEELGGKPALVAYEFQHDLERLRKALGKDTPHLGGGVTSKRQRELEDAWNAGALPVLLVQPQSVAHGLNLQGVGAAVVWHSLTWNLEHYEQLIRRVWRQGQKERVVVHHIVAWDTVDNAMLAGLRHKDRTQRALLGALKQYRAQRG